MDGGYTVDQSAYTRHILEHHGFANATPADTPLSVLPPHPIENEPPVDHPDPALVSGARQFVGEMNQLATWSRPDIAFGVNTLARQQTNPNQHLIADSKRMLRYLSGTTDLCLSYQHVAHAESSRPIRIEGYADASHAPERERNSQTGYILFLDGCPILWSSKRQPTISLSAAEAETIAASEFTRQLIGITHFLRELGLTYSMPTLHEDNTTVLSFTSTQPMKSRLRHVEIRHLYVKERMLAGDLRLQQIASSDQIAECSHQTTCPYSLRSIAPALSLNPT